MRGRIQLHCVYLDVAHVASVLSACYICFTHMLQLFYIDVAYVSHISCNSMFHLYQMYVASISCCKGFTGHGE